MKTNISFITAGVLALALIFGLTAAACSKAGGGGGGKANPATDFSYDLTADGQGILIKGYTGAPGKVVIPAKIEDIPVVEIGEEAFNGKSMTWSVDININSQTASGNVGSKANEKAGITAIIIPDTIKKIGREAFANTAITSIVIPDSVTELGVGGVFGGDSRLFQGCKELTEIKFSDSLEIIPEQIGGPALKKVNLPKNLKRIADYSFIGCGELIELIIPDTLTTVEFGAFYKGEWLKYPEENYYMGGTVGENAFEGCDKLPIKTRQRLQELGYTGKF
jgi:hypothetical protein